jgi:Bacterial Ig domain
MQRGPVVRMERLAMALAVVGTALLIAAGAHAAVLPRQAETPTPTAVAEEGCQPQALLEAPRVDQPLRGIVTVGGWAVDLTSPAGTGVFEVNVYLDGYGSEPGFTFIGKAEYGGSRVDVAQQFNDVRFARSAFNLSWDASTAGAGSHTLVILYRTRCGWANLTQALEVDGPTVIVTIEEPAQGSNVGGPVRIQGWAADPRATIGSGVDAVDVYLDGQITTRGVPLGELTYGDLRQDVGAALGGDNEAARARYTRTGFTFNWNPTTVPVGTHYLTFYAHAPDGAVARSLALEVTLSSVTAARTATPGAGIVVPRPATGGLSLTVGPTTASSVALTWSSVAGAVSYAVYAAQGTAAFFSAQSGLTETSVVVAGLAPTRSYRFFVRALDAAGNELAQSNTVSITTGAAAIPATPTLVNAPRPSPTVTNQLP